MMKSLIAVLFFAAFVSANIGFGANQLECTACEYAVRYLETKVSNTSTTEEIIKEFENVCKLAPASSRDACDSTIEKYGPTIVFLLLKAATPEAVCKALTLCA